MIKAMLGFVIVGQVVFYLTVRSILKSLKEFDEDVSI